MSTSILIAPHLADGVGTWISRRDAAILALAESRTGRDPSFAEAIAVLHDAVAELIPNGRVFVLDSWGTHPIIGSLVSGVGISLVADALTVVRVGRVGGVQLVRRFGR